MNDFSFTLVETDKGDYWEVREKFPSGMTAVLEMQCAGGVDRLDDYNVSFYITKKRNRYPDFLALTGRDGLAPAMWALERLQEFEDNINYLFEGNYETRILVRADDSRRWKIYERVLTRRGYTVTMVDRKRTLVKRVRRTNA